MDQQLHIYVALVGEDLIRTDDQCQLHCLDGFRFSDENQKHNKQIVPAFAGRGKYVQRFERQG